MIFNKLKAVIVIAVLLFLNINIYAYDKPIWEKKIHSNKYFTDAIFSPDGSKIYSVEEKTLDIIETKTGKILKSTATDGQVIGFSTNLSYYFTADKRERFTSVSKVDNLTNKTIQTIDIYTFLDKTDKECEINNCALSPDGKYLYFAGRSIVNIANLEVKNALIFKVDTETMKIVNYKEYNDKQDYRSGLYRIAISSDNHIAVKKVKFTLDSLGVNEILDEISISLIDATTLEEITKIDVEKDISYFTFSPNSKMLGANIGSKIVIYDMKTKPNISKMEDFPEISTYSSIFKFSENSEYIVFSKRDNRVLIVKLIPYSEQYVYNIPYLDLELYDITNKYIFGYAYTAESNGDEFSTKYLALFHAYWDDIGIEDYNPLGIFIQITPNPIENNAKIEYILPNTGNVIINIINLEGISKILFEGYGQTGKNNFSFNTSEYSSGQYIMRMQFNGQSLTQKLIISK